MFLPLTIMSSTLPAATQYQSYSAPAFVAEGGTPPYVWSVTTADATLPEGMTINPSTGKITSSLVGGQGGYKFQLQVRDTTGATSTALETIGVTADNTYGGCAIFPANSIFHQPVDTLPVDTSPAAPISSYYLHNKIRPFFGSDAEPGPNGIPFIRLPYNQPLVAVTMLLYGKESDPGPYPFPSYAPVEGSANNGPNTDRHVLVLQTAGGGQPCKLYEVWQGVANNNGSTWNASNGAYWDLSSNNLRPYDWTSADAAGLPIMPLTLNYDEVAANVINHPIRFTLNHMLNYAVWPARHAAGVGNCSDASGARIQTRTLLSQSAPPASCTFSGPSGEIYRLKADVDTSVCSADPQSVVILQAMKKYGIILADNGLSGGLIGTPDARWNNKDLACLGNFTLSQFEPVNVSSLEVSANSGATKGSGGSAAATPIVATSTIPVMPSSTPVVASGTAQLLAEIAALEAQLSALEKQVLQTTTGPSSPQHSFTRDLSVGAAGTDVAALQQFLIAKNTGSAAQNLAAAGATNYFGILTQAALVEYQRSLGIVPAAGYFGSITRAYVNK